MTDILRTRIAKVLHRLYGPLMGGADHGWDDEPHGTQDEYLRDADAVIRELGRFYEDSLQSTVFSTIRVLEQRSTPRHFTQEATE